MKISPKILTAGLLLGLLFVCGCGEISNLLPWPEGQSSQSEAESSAAPAQEETQAVPEETEMTALTVDDAGISLSEAKVYAFLMQQPLVEAAGDTVLYGVHPDGGVLEDRLAAELKKQMTQIAVLAAAAENEGLALSEEETENVRQRAQLLLSEYPELSEEGVTEGAALKAYTRSMLAGLYYDQKTADYVPELTEMEKASCRVREVCQIFIAEGDITHLGKYKSVDELAAALLKQAKDGENFEALSKTYSSPGTQRVVVLNSDGYAYDADAWVDDDFAAAAAGLAEGDVSDVVKTSMGLHILKCLSVGDADLAAEAEQALIDQKKKTYFSDIYASLSGETVVSEGEGWAELFKKD